MTVLPGTPRDYNLSKEEWLAMRGLAEDRNIVVKPANRESCVVLWDREDYLAEAEKLFQDIGMKILTSSLKILINIKSQQILVKCISFRNS